VRLVGRRERAHLAKSHMVPVNDLLLRVDNPAWAVVAAVAAVDTDSK